MTKHSTVFSLLVAFIAIVPLIVVANEDVLNTSQEEEVIAAQYGENSSLIPANIPRRESPGKNQALVILGTGIFVLLVTWAAVEFVRTQKTPMSLTEHNS